MAFKIIQNTKINSKDFTFLDPADVTYPVAPLVSTNLLPPVGGVFTLKIRATLYINTDINKEPKIKSVVEKDNILTIIYKHSFSESTPETCDIWYIEVDYTSNTAKDITQVISFLQGSKKEEGGELGDPPTSRGTKTDTQD